MDCCSPPPTPNTGLGSIANPLAGIPRHKLLDDVARLAEEQGLTEHLYLLRQGALVAQDPGNLERIDGEYALNDAQKSALQQEVLHKWRVPKLLYLTIIACSIGAAVQGWDQEGSNGANLSFPDQFGIGGKSDHDTLLVGLINSAPYIGSALVGCWLSDPLNNYLGRKCKSWPLVC